MGSPSYDDVHREWAQHLFDPTERAMASAREREWTAIAQSETGIIREMARCLREIGAGRVP